MNATSRRWDIVCKVVDNYGDAGVAWRLARQLAHELRQHVTLWIDDPAPLARLAPGLDPDARSQAHDGVFVQRGPEGAIPWTPGDVVVDAFGGGLPHAWIETMAHAARRPVWIVLEHLTAEGWADHAHLRPSPEPRTGLARWYWCPGFTAATGGLLREAGLFSRRDAFLRDPDARASTLRSVGASASVGACVTLVFCYPTPALADLFESWAEGDTPIVALVPPGVAVDALDRWTGGRVPHPGNPFERGALTLCAIPFVSQAAFDRLLWSCDIAIVRGEDSFVRAQWAALPFAWHAYPQSENAHHAKVGAFLDRYLALADASEARAVRGFTMALNRGDGPALAEAWPPFERLRSRLSLHRVAWGGTLAAQEDLASALAQFAMGKL